MPPRRKKPAAGEKFGNPFFCAAEAREKFSDLLIFIFVRYPPSPLKKFGDDVCLGIPWFYLFKKQSRELTSHPAITEFCQGLILFSIFIAFVNFWKNVMFAFCIEKNVVNKHTLRNKALSTKNCTNLDSNKNFRHLLLSENEAKIKIFFYQFCNNCSGFSHSKAITMQYTFFESKNIGIFTNFFMDFKAKL